MMRCVQGKRHCRNHVLGSQGKSGLIAPRLSPVLDFAPWAISSVAERFLHTEEATGSIPVSPTIPSDFLNIRPPGPCLSAPAQSCRFLDRIMNVGYTSQQLTD